MNDKATPPPADNDRLDKVTAVLTALVDETRQSKVLISDVIVQRSEYAADINDLKASIDTTRRALDPEVLGAHVSGNIDQFMGETVQKFAKGIQLNHDAGQANQIAAKQTNAAAQDMTDRLGNIDRQANALTNIAGRLEERDERSKYDWVTLGCAMVVSAALAGVGAFYFAKATIEADDFQRSIALISQDNDAGWCDIANGQIVDGNSGAKFCAIHMPKYETGIEKSE